MPVARFLRLLLTIFVLVNGPLSVLGWDVAGAYRAEPVAVGSLSKSTPLRPSPRAVCEHVGDTDKQRHWGRDRLAANHVGDSATSAGSGTLRSARRRSGLLSILSRAFAAHGETDRGIEAEFEMGDGPDLADEEGPQGFVADAWPGLRMPRLPAPYLEPNLWGIQPSNGHPRGDDEPPRA
jgi:hypothetical protein